MQHPKIDEAQRITAFLFHDVESSKRIKVYGIGLCFQAFLSVYDISEKNLRRIRNLKLKGDRPVDRRGKGITNTLPVEIHELVQKHVKSFPLKETHYCGENCITCAKFFNKTNVPNV